MHPAPPHILGNIIGRQTNEVQRTVDERTPVLPFHSRRCQQRSQRRERVAGTPTMRRHPQPIGGFLAFRCRDAYRHDTHPFPAPHTCKHPEKQS